MVADQADPVVGVEGFGAEEGRADLEEDLTIRPRKNPRLNPILQTLQRTRPTQPRIIILLIIHHFHYQVSDFLANTSFQKLFLWVKFAIPTPILLQAL